MCPILSTLTSRAPLVICLRWDFLGPRPCNGVLHAAGLLRRDLSMDRWGSEGSRNEKMEQLIMRCGGYKTSAVVREFWAQMIFLSCPELNDGTNLCISHWLILDSAHSWGEGMTLRNTASLGQRQCLGRNSAISLQQAALPLRELSAWVLKELSG